MQNNNIAKYYISSPFKSQSFKEAEKYISLEAVISGFIINHWDLFYSKYGSEPVKLNYHHRILKNAVRVKDLAIITDSNEEKRNKILETQKELIKECQFLVYSDILGVSKGMQGEIDFAKDECKIPVMNLSLDVITRYQQIMQKPTKEELEKAGQGNIENYIKEKEREDVRRCSKNGIRNNKEQNKRTRKVLNSSRLKH